MRRIEEANKFELVLSIKALVARALADEVIEGRDVGYWHKADIVIVLNHVRREPPATAGVFLAHDVRFWHKADIDACPENVRS